MVWALGSGGDDLGKELERRSNEEYLGASTWLDFDREGWLEFVEKVNRHLEQYPDQKRYGIVVGEKLK